MSGSSFLIYKLSWMTWIISYIKLHVWKVSYLFYKILHVWENICVKCVTSSLLHIADIPSVQSTSGQLCEWIYCTSNQSGHTVHKPCIHTGKSLSWALPKGKKWMNKFLIRFILFLKNCCATCLSIRLYLFLRVCHFRFFQNSLQKLGILWAYLT